MKMGGRVSGMAPTHMRSKGRHNVSVSISCSNVQGSEAVLLGHVDELWMPLHQLLHSPVDQNQISNSLIYMHSLLSGQCYRGNVKGQRADVLGDEKVLLLYISVQNLNLPDIEHAYQIKLCSTLQLIPIHYGDLTYARNPTTDALCRQFWRL